LDLQNTYFVGDSNHEIEVSKAVGINSIAVTWGFLSEAKLRANNPNYVVNGVSDLEKIIL
jgi:phosphoglycolate phosphatase-like HAD superfamily hydrolase